MSISFSQIFIFLIILTVPLLLPLSQKKWIWFSTILAGYLLYILWGIYLHATSDITEYGTGYGIFILPYIIFIFIVGAVLEKWLRKNRRVK